MKIRQAKIYGIFTKIAALWVAASALLLGGCGEGFDVAPEEPVKEGPCFVGIAVPGDYCTKTSVNDAADGF